MISSNFSEFLKNTPTKNPTNSPTKASAHFNNKRFCETKKKYLKSCKYCSVEITDCGNTTNEVAHLSRCKPDLLLINKKRSMKNYIFIFLQTHIK